MTKRERSQKYYQNNKEKIKSDNKIWALNNPTKVKEYKVRAYHKKILKELESNVNNKN